MRTLDIQDATTHLFQFGQQAARGESFLIATSGTPRVLAIPVDALDAGHVRRIGFLEACLESRVIDALKDRGVVGIRISRAGTFERPAGNSGAFWRRRLTHVWMMRASATYPGK